MNNQLLGRPGADKDCAKVWGGGSSPHVNPGGLGGLAEDSPKGPRKEVWSHLHSHETQGEQRPISFGKSGKYGKIFLLCIGGDLGAIFIKRIAQKLRVIILLQFGLATFRIDFGEPKNPPCSWLSNLADVTITPQASYI